MTCLWEPIETAPKDGTLIVLWGEFDDASEPFVGWYVEDEVKANHRLPNGPFVWQQHEASTIAEKCVRFWLPLPPAPESAK